MTSVACNRTKKYQLQGEVVGKNAVSREIIVKHGEIPGFMDAMTMPYRVNNPANLREVQIGDTISADLVVTFGRGNLPSDYWLENLRITGKSGGGSSSEAAPHMLMPGEHVPNIALVDQDGRTIHLADFAGKALLVTFIYTRCPMPDFCPRLSSQFAEIQKDLKKNPAAYAKTHLLTISFDPKYDKPSILRKYGLSYLDNDAAGFSHWNFAVANAPDLPLLAKAFGLQYEVQENQILHSLNIVLIAPDGTIAKFWSTDWTAKELLDTTLNVANSARRGT